jgi:hypothetical protein
VWENFQLQMCVRSYLTLLEINVCCVLIHV